MVLRSLLAAAALALLVTAGQAIAFGPIGADIRLSTTGTDGDLERYAAEPAIAHDPETNRYLITWDATDLPTEGEAEIFGQLVTAAGNPVGPDDFRISHAGADGDASRNVFASAAAYSPAVDGYLVVWEADGLATAGETEIFGRRVSAAGAAVGTDDLRISNAGTDADDARDAAEPALAYNSAENEYLVVWEADAGATDGEFEIYGRRVSAAGAGLGGEFPISGVGEPGDASRGASGAKAVYNALANEYLVVWSADALTDNGFEVYGRRVSAAGAGIGEAFPISDAGASGSDRDAFLPAVAFNAARGEYLVTWRGNELATAQEFEIFGQRIGATGTELGSDFRISNVGADGDAARAPSGSAVAYDSAHDEYVVTWHGDGLATDGEVEMFGQRLGGDGTQLGADFRISKAGLDGDPSREASFGAIGFSPASRSFLSVFQAEGVGLAGDYEIFAHAIDATRPPAPPPPPPPPPPPGVTDTAVSLTVTGARRQRALRRKALVVRAACGAEACTVAARATVRVRRAKGSRTFRTRRVVQAVAANARARVELKLSRKVRRAARRALARGRKVTARVTVTATDAAGNVATGARSIRIRR